MSETAAPSADRVADYWWDQRAADAMWAEGAEKAIRADWEREQMEKADAEFE